MTEFALERAAEDWIADYFNARHLIRTRDWLLELEPDAGEALRVAALTHDIERRAPGSRPVNPRIREWDDAAYVLGHSTRSAWMVSAWLQTQGVQPELRRQIERLILHHEIGGYRDADLLQAADSLSFLEVNAGRALAWVMEGRCDPPEAQAKLDQMRDRVAVAAARPIAASLHAEATAALEEGLERCRHPR